jgi:hypothetical protein
MGTVRDDVLVVCGMIAYELIERISKMEKETMVMRQWIERRQRMRIPSTLLLEYTPRIMNPLWIKNIV